MTPTPQHPLSRNTFEELARIRRPNMVSIYLPMDLKGQEQNQHLAQARLKKCLKEARETLSDWGMEAATLSEYLKPAEALLSDVDLWRNPSEGLAIFLSPDAGMQYYRVPVKFEDFTYVGQRFYLSPLLPLYHGTGQYYLLELSQDYVKLFSASRFDFSDLQLAEVAPTRLEEAVGFDYEQKNLQFRTGQSGQGANFHGQGAGKDEERKEVISFFRKVSEGVKQKIEDTQAPLVLACVEELVPYFEKANNLNNKIVGHVYGDPEHRNDDQRHKESWEVVRRYFEKERKNKTDQIRESLHSDKSSDLTEHIIPAAINGRVDTLFIAENCSLYGKYNQDKNSIQLADKRKKDNTSLSDLAALKAFLQGGRVYTVAAGEMPVEDSQMNALFRY